MTSIPGCIACGSAPDFVPVLGQLARCRTCGFVTWPGATVAAVDHLYDERYFSDLEYADYQGSEPSLRRSMRQHLDQMGHYDALRGALLEIGCAYGFFLDEARHHFDRVTGVDVAAGPVRRAVERFGVDAMAGSFLDLPIDAASFDVACLWDTIEHLPRPDLFLEKARHLLRPGGRLFLTTGDIGSLNARLRGRSWRQIHPPTHVHYFSRDTMARLLGRLGFTVLGFETAAYHHSLYNVLATLGMREGLTAGVSRAALDAIGEPLARRVGFWINLRDTMFVAAARP